MIFSLFSLACGILNFCFFFKKKLLALLMLELCFVSIIFLFFFHSFGSLGICSVFSMMLFMSFLVTDSVLGLCLLVVSVRNSTSFLDSFFSF